MTWRLKQEDLPGRPEAMQSISEGRDNDSSDGNLRAIDEVRICL